MLSRSHGLILVTGPTGSGKTTTLYAALASTRDETKNIITVEDPVEYELAGVTQTNAFSEIGLTFARQLRAILRQDPDVILVGEIRDDETADVAIRAALTGHLVLSTLHTNSAVAAITRLQDMGVPSYLISSSIAGIIAQRLVRMNCRHCRGPMEPSEAEREEWASFFDMPLNATYTKGQGCEQCGGTGTRGRVAVLELLEVGSSLRKAISSKTDLDVLRGAARSEGMRTLRDDARAKIVAGHIAPDEAMRVLMGQED
jgi:type II secretory ATPase GspE/PulE/Tfp pilus assembly ATPase PilB-like protein